MICWKYVCLYLIMVRIFWREMFCCWDFIKFIVDKVFLFIVFFVEVIFFIFCLVVCNLVICFGLLLFFFDFFLLILVVWEFVFWCNWLYFCFKCLVFFKGELLVIVFKGFVIKVVRVLCKLFCFFFILVLVKLYCIVVLESFFLIFGFLELYFL